MPNQRVLVFAMALLVGVAVIPANAATDVTFEVISKIVLEKPTQPTGAVAEPKPLERPSDAAKKKEAEPKKSEPKKGEKKAEPKKPEPKKPEPKKESEPKKDSAEKKK